MPNACDSLGTIWIGTDPQNIAPGATGLFKLEPGQPVLIIAYAASSYQPGSWWDASTVSLYAKKDGKTSFMMSDKPIPGNVLHDGQAGLRYLAEPVPLHTKEWMDVYVQNRAALAADLEAYAEAVWMGDDNLDRYEADEAYRNEVKARIALLIRGR